MDPNINNLVRHLHDVEMLSMRQIARVLGMCRKRVSRILKKEAQAKPLKTSILTSYERLIATWYKDYPSLKATQTYGRLKSYGFSGSYPTVCLYTRKYRHNRSKSYHELEFLPGEEAQVDWMEWKLSSETVYGFVFILSYSRYLYLNFYPRYTMEFFLHGHIQAFKEIGGIAHKNRYDNTKSVVISRKPELKLNSQFLDFSRHYSFSIHLCNPRKPNEKGRVERVIRDVKDFLRVTPCTDLRDLNKKADLWRQERNKRVHRSTGKMPLDALKEEKLKALPSLDYKPYRPLSAVIGKTGFIEFDTNRYSVPVQYVGNSCQILAYPDHIEAIVGNSKIASHRRIYEKKQKVEHPSHREKLLKTTPNFKYQRIYQLMKNMDKSLAYFLARAEQDGRNSLDVAYELFHLLNQASKQMLLSAVREANNLEIFKVHYLQSLLHLPAPSQDMPVYPQNAKLLEIDYEKRDLSEYDEFI